MKKILIAYVIFVYFVPISLFLTFYLIFTKQLQDSYILGTFAIPILFMIMVSALTVVNILIAVSSVVRSRYLSFRLVMIFKLFLIPFYIVNFICWMIGSMVFHLSLVVWPMLPFIVAYTYFTMLGTSAHIIAILFNLRQNKLITTKQFFTHCLLQLIFTLDVLDSIYLTIKRKKFENPERAAI